MHFILVALNVVLLCVASNTVPTPSSLSPGPLEEMPVRQMPVVQNFWGATYLRRDVEPGFGMVALGPITMTPYSVNFQNSTFSVNNKPKLVISTEGWAGCEGRRAADGIVNHVRMPFETHAVMQRWKLSQAGIVNVHLDGPFARSCAEQPPCGWGVSMPIDRENFQSNVTTWKDEASGETFQVIIVMDTKTNAVTASTIWPVTSITKNTTFPNTYDVLIPSTNTVGYVMAVSNSADGALDVLTSLIGSKFSSAWDHACTKWDKRWRSAFETGSEHFSGNLPVVSFPVDPELERLYYWAALPMVSLERTNLVSQPRTVVISQGPSNSFDGSADMGGSGQFTWDLSFAAASSTLLDPTSTRTTLSFIIMHSNFQTKPFQIPQAWDAYPPLSTPPGGMGCYVFDYISAYLFIHQYVSLTNDTEFLFTPIQLGTSSDSITPLDYLGKLAWAWKDFPRWDSSKSQYITEYGDNKRLFLEAVPTYMGAVAALQIANAGMLFSYARLLEQVDKNKYSSAITQAINNASKIVNDTMIFQRVPESGYFACLYSNGSNASVRAISDFEYVAVSLGLIGRKLPSQLSGEFRNMASSFFMNELMADGWVRALSLEDPVMKNVMSLTPGIEDLVSMRSDWTGTGAYGGLAGLAVDALADMDQGFSNAIRLLKNLTKVTHTSNAAQGIATMTPPYYLISTLLNKNDGKPAPEAPYGAAWPEFFDEEGWEPFWPSSMRAVQNAVAAIVDAYVRSVFGWRPDWIWSNDKTPSQAIQEALFLPNVSRGVEGVLSFVRTPYGLINITSSTDGLSWKFS